MTGHGPDPAAHPTDTRPPVARVLRTVAACEWQLVRSDPGWWLTVALILGCVAYAAANGRARISERQRAVAEAQRDEARRLDSLARQLGKIERGEAPIPDAPYRDPRNAIYVGRGQGAAVAYLPDAPLAAAAVGLSDLYPQVLRVSAGSKDTFLFADEIENPTHLLAGSFDLAFVIVYLLPLLLIAAGSDVLSGERERGTLALTLATSAPLPAVLAGKLLVRLGGIALAAILAMWLCLQPGVAGLGAMAGLTLGVVLYTLFWAALFLLINALGRDSSFNAMALILLWGLLLVVAPGAVNAAAQVLYPAPSRSELIIGVREAAVDAERDRDASEARYREEHPGEPAPAGDDRTRRTLDVTVAADARADTMLAEQESCILRQRALAERLGGLLPSCLMYDAIAELAGTGHTRWDAYLRRIGEFHATWRDLFLTRARAGAPLAQADYDRFPRFDATPDPTGESRVARARVGRSFATMAAVTLVLAVLAFRRLSRAG